MSGSLAGITAREKCLISRTRINGAPGSRQLETQLRDSVTRGAMPFPKPKRRFAFGWLHEQDNAKALRERQLYRYAQWAFWAVVGAVLVGIIGVLVTVLHSRFFTRRFRDFRHRCALTLNRLGLRS
jgi:hypothetical protein